MEYAVSVPPGSGESPSLAGATGWLNSQAIALPGLRGKVVLVEFMTYTCVNWLRTLPYVSAWAKKYKDDGLVVVGVQSPEFGFEHDVENVRNALCELHLEYPVAIDNKFSVWRSFNNEYWPALYLIDAQGRVRYQQFGEGNYDQTEAAIRGLLSEVGNRTIGNDRAAISPVGVEAPADWKNLMSQESYVGYERSVNFSSPEATGLVKGKSYTMPSRLALNHWALGGDWDVQADRVELKSASGQIAYRFHARDLNLVLTRSSGSGSVRFRVLIDGHSPEVAHGADIDRDGEGTVVAPRLYQLIRQPSPIADRTVEIQFFGAGVSAYVFTFG